MIVCECVLNEAGRDRDERATEEENETEAETRTCARGENEREKEERENSQDGEKENVVVLVEARAAPRSSACSLLSGKMRKGRSGKQPLARPHAPRRYEGEEPGRLAGLGE